MAEPTAYGPRRVYSTLDVDSLTPDTIRSMLRAAESGDMSRQAELFERMEQRDGVLDSLLRTRKSGVLSYPWAVVPADETPQAARAAEFCHDVIAGIKDFEQCLFDMMDAVGKGASIMEIKWETSATQWTVCDLVWRPQWWFELAADGESFKLKSEHGQATAINPLNFLIVRMRARSGFQSRVSLLRSCIRGFIVRHYSWKDWLAFAEIYGMPMATGTLPEGTLWDSDEASEMWSMLQSLGADGRAMFRAGADFKVWPQSGQGTGEVFTNILDAGEREMTLAVLGQTLTSGGEKGGSYALGKVHNMVRFDLIQSDARKLGSAIKDQLFTPLVELNLGPTVPVPHFAIAVAEPEDLGQLATQIEVLSKSGLAIPAAWVYEKFGIPEPEGGEETLSGPPSGPQMFEARPASLDVQVVSNAPEPRPQIEQFAMLNGMAPFDVLTKLNQTPPFIAEDSEALRFLREKRIPSTAAYARLQGPGRARAWYVEGLGQAKTKSVAAAIYESSKNGWLTDKFLERLEGAGLAVPGAEKPGKGQMANWHARLVYHMNVNGARSASMWRALQEERELRPYGQWICTTPCEICAPLCDQIQPLDGALFTTYWPQVHFGCECQVVSVSQLELDRERQGEVGTGVPPVDVPPEFQRNPADSFFREGDEPTTSEGVHDWNILQAFPTLASTFGD